MKGVVHAFQGKCGKQISKGHWRLADLVICSPADIIFNQNIEETSEHFYQMSINRNRVRVEEIVLKDSPWARFAVEGARS